MKSEILQGQAAARCRGGRGLLSSTLLGREGPRSTETAVKARRLKVQGVLHTKMTGQKPLDLTSVSPLCYES